MSKIQEIRAQNYIYDQYTLHEKPRRTTTIQLDITLISFYIKHSRENV